MGNEFGQTSEWNYKSELDWYLLEYDGHKKLQTLIKDLNQLLRTEKALYINQFDIHGFEWIDLNHRDECVMVYARKGKTQDDELLVILNMTPIARWDWEIYVTGKTYKKEIFNSDDKKYWGTGDVYNTDIRQELVDEDEKRYKLTINLPPLAGIVLK
jgi:1,4-alpha-glucan branching enzyme